MHIPKVIVQILMGNIQMMSGNVQTQRMALSSQSSIVQLCHGDAQMSHEAMHIIRIIIK